VSDRAARGLAGAQGSAQRAAISAESLCGGTITHNYAVGRGHWYHTQPPDPFAAALKGAKAAVDPGGALNPGVLIGA